MRSVNVAELKSHLSEHLSLVKAGQEIVVRQRNTPIAKIVPFTAAADSDAEERALVAAGKLRLGKGPLPASFWKTPAARVSLKRILAAIEAERREV